MRNKVILADNMEVLPSLPAESVALIYIDPPFNTGKTQQRQRMQTVQDDENGDRTGFQGKRYRSVPVSVSRFDDTFDDYIDFLAPRLEEALRLLTPNGSLLLHVDPNEVHYCKVLLDSLFGRSCFKNEIIWSYDYGGKPKNRWASKHDNILWYVRNPEHYVFNFDAIDRIPYMAPGLVGPEKAKRGKVPTDVWWHSIVPTNGQEKTGYATQKPLGIVERIVRVHSEPDAHVMDFFAGSGTLAEAALKTGRSFTVIDNSREAVQVMAERLKGGEVSFHGFEPEPVSHNRTLF